MKKRDRFNTCPAFFVTNFNGLFVLSCQLLVGTSRRSFRLPGCTLFKIKAYLFRFCSCLPTQLRVWIWHNPCSLRRHQR